MQKITIRQYLMSICLSSINFIVYYNLRHAVLKLNTHHTRTPRAHTTHAHHARTPREHAHCFEIWIKNGENHSQIVARLIGFF